VSPGYSGGGGGECLLRNLRLGLFLLIALDVEHSGEKDIFLVTICVPLFVGVNFDYLRNLQEGGGGARPCRCS
jgi:hypothetical protein